MTSPLHDAAIEAGARLLCAEMSDDFREGAAGSDRGAVRGAPRLPQVRQAAGRISDRAQADLRLYGRPEQSAELPATPRLETR